MDDWALITGASAGIGLELADLFARAKFNLVLVARSGARLKELEDKLKGRYNVQCLVLTADLARPGAAADLLQGAGSRRVSVLVNNAGFGAYGEFAKTDIKTQTEIVQVNIVALMELTHLFLQPMLARKQGRILNVASTAAFQPGPFVNAYYASKAFVYSFSYALTEELAGSGVSVTTLCPGPTSTEFFDRAHIKMKQGFPMMSARAVAEEGFDGLMKGKRVVIAGMANKIVSFVAKRSPPRVTSMIVRRIHRRGT
jgi:short-subunit dehydrogenase